jgi:hypothetical protein
MRLSRAGRSGRRRSSACGPVDHIRPATGRTLKLSSDDETCSVSMLESASSSSSESSCDTRSGRADGAAAAPAVEVDGGELASRGGRRSERGWHPAGLRHSSVCEAMVLSDEKRDCVGCRDRGR